MINEQQFIYSAKFLGCPVASVKAVAEVESREGGFDPEGFPKTLFEGHWFYKLTKGKYSVSHPSLCYSKWTKQFYGKDWKAEKDRLAEAMALDRTSAIMSASWGMFQIMGFNYAQVGCRTPQEFITLMCKSEDSHLDLFTKFVKSNGLSDELARQDWDGFALRYNGVEYKKNDYAGKLARAFAKHNK